MATRIGEHRAWYSKNVEAGPSRFANQGADYKAWAARADDCTAYAIVYRDGVEIARMDSRQVLAWFHWHVASCSMGWALKHEGYSVEEVAA